MGSRLYTRVGYFNLAQDYWVTLNFIFTWLGGNKNFSAKKISCELGKYYDQLSKKGIKRIGRRHPLPAVFARFLQPDRRNVAFLMRRCAASLPARWLLCKLQSIFYRYAHNRVHPRSEPFLDVIIKPSPSPHQTFVKQTLNRHRLFLQSKCSEKQKQICLPKGEIQLWKSLYR